MLHNVKFNIVKFWCAEVDGNLYLLIMALKLFRYGAASCMGQACWLGNNSYLIIRKSSCSSMLINFRQSSWTWIQRTVDWWLTYEWASERARALCGFWSRVRSLTRPSLLPVMLPVNWLIIDFTLTMKDATVMSINRNAVTKWTAGGFSTRHSTQGRCLIF